METVGVKKIFSRSQERYKLQCTEYFGDGDSKGFSEVQDVQYIAKRMLKW